ncbi:MAG: 1,4-alpha-glucan branching protein GlgB [Puniceicoccales bacterium]|jgi:1,4-alpha-glucan branching enzyme|nr:1,4-alpha-glucan branching protein GlgB [Puniceicoccales bacterium]
MIISHCELESLLGVHNSQPHGLLGMHPYVENGKVCTIVVRAFLQDARRCFAVDSVANEKFQLEQIDGSGFFEGIIKTRTKVFKYKLLKESYGGELLELDDPYSFLPTIGERERDLFAWGRNIHIYEQLGANFREIDGVAGFSFGVWAPNAKAVSVVGDFNSWDGRYHQMRLLGNSGIWELFIPALKNFDSYKFQILNARGDITLKSDPYASHFEGAPNNASKLFNVSGYDWQDGEWLASRATTDWQKSAISAYELHMDSWRRVVADNNRPLTYRELANELAKYLSQMGFTHVELMPPTEHPFLGSWGYQVTGFFSPTHRYGTPHDFMYLVDTLHRHNIGVIIDWVPAHFPRDSFALEDFDGTKLYEHDDPRIGCHRDWGTLIFNYGRHEVRNFLLSSAVSWAERFHVDGIRVDAVASMLYLDYSREAGEWLPNRYGGKENIEAIEFLRELNHTFQENFPGFITIAEESTAFGGITHGIEHHGLGFDFKWNMGWMHDVLLYFSKDPIFRKYHHNQLTFAMLYQHSEHFICALSHDEVVHGKCSLIYKMPGNSLSEKMGHLRCLYAYMWFWPGKKTLFMGQEFGQTGEWNYHQSLDWHLLQYEEHSGVQRLVGDLNGMYRTHAFLHETDSTCYGFEWACCDDCENSVISFMRFGQDSGEKCIIICNLTPIERENYRLGVPLGGYWKEVLNTDSAHYAGQNRGNCGHVHADNCPMHRWEFSLNLRLPPLTTLVLMPERVNGGQISL